MTVIKSLAQLKPVEAVMPVLDQFTGEALKGPDKKPLTITLVSIDSARYFARANEDNKEELDVPESEKDELWKYRRLGKRLAGCVVGWSHPTVFGEFSYERAVEILSDKDYEWLATQVMNHASKREHFFAK